MGGRVVAWIAIARLLVALGRRLGFSAWGTVLASIVFLGVNQGFGFGAAPLFTHFEAKAIAWPLLLASLLTALDRRIALTALLVGLTFSMHPGLGLWGGGTLLASLIAHPSTRNTTMRWVPLAAVASLPGLIPQLQGLAQAGLSDGAAEFVVLNRIPHHVDPFSFGERGPLILSLMVVFNLSWAWRRRGDYVSRLVGVYQVALTVTTVTFVAARAAGGFELLLLTPFRVFPVFTALLFFYVVADHLISSRSATDFASGRMRGTSRRVQLVSGALATVATLVLWNPVPRWVNAVDATVEGWRDSTTDLEKALLWFPDNTPLDARVASPPWVEEIFYLSESPVRQLGGDSIRPD